MLRTHIFRYEMYKKVIFQQVNKVNISTLTNTELFYEMEVNNFGRALTCVSNRSEQDIRIWLTSSRSFVPGRLASTCPIHTNDTIQFATNRIFAVKLGINVTE